MSEVSELSHTSTTRSFKCHNRALSMKYSICTIHLLPKAADLRKKAFDELPLNMAIVLQLLSRNALITFLG